MSFRDILVQVDESATSSGRCALAVALAKRWEAALTGVFLPTPYPSDVFAAERLADLPAQLAQTLRAQHQSAAKRAVRAAEQTLRRAADTAAISYAWRQIEGGDEAALLHAVRRTDLAVFPPRAMTSMGGRAIDAAALGLGSGGPMLIVPETGGWIEAPKRVVIGWKNAREAARALHDAWPFISAAEEVTVVMVQPSRDEGAYLTRRLARHDLQARLILVEGDEGMSDAEALRRQVKALDADLVVMGLYGRPRLSEWILGGVSHEFMADPPAPLLVSH